MNQRGERYSSENRPHNESSDISQNIGYKQLTFYFADKKQKNLFEDVKKEEVVEHPRHIPGQLELFN
ncbi:MAG: hypothetical protein Q7S74_05210 [Nanoarchaeota archaeon]|nr:hypothetical protein [Nanoarchaeota archaeon]